MYLIFDTETTGLAANPKAPVTEIDNWPRMVQIAWQLHDRTGKLLSQENLIIKPEGYTIPYNTVKIHGITTERALKEGHPLSEVLDQLEAAIAKAEFGVGHNIIFDYNIVGAEFYVPEEKIPWPHCPPLTPKMNPLIFVPSPVEKGVNLNGQRF